MMTMGIMLFAVIQVKPGLLYVQYVHAIRQGRFPNRNGLLSATKKENVEKANLD